MSISDMLFTDSYVTRVTIRVSLVEQEMLTLPEHLSNIMAKRKNTKGQTTIYKTLHIKTKYRVTRTPLKPRVNTGALEG
jgi:hypothetical protein